MCIGVAADFVSLFNEFLVFAVIGAPVVYDIKASLITVFVKDGDGNCQLVGKVVVKCKSSDSVPKTRPGRNFLGP